MPAHPSKDLVPKGSSFEIPGDILKKALTKVHKPFPLISVLFKEPDSFSMKFIPYDNLTHEEYNEALIPKTWPPEVLLLFLLVIT